jgi:hypothetical protein
MLLNLALETPQLAPLINLPHLQLYATPLLEFAISLKLALELQLSAHLTPMLPHLLFADHQ